MILKPKIYKPRHCENCRAEYVPASGRQKFCSDCGTAEPTVTPAVRNTAPPLAHGRRKARYFPLGPLLRWGSCQRLTFVTQAAIA
jgi:hypothetical protein